MNAPDNRPPLTAKQKEVLDAIHTLIMLNDLVPTHQELANLLHLSRATITIHVSALENKGYLVRSRNWRDMKLLSEEEGLQKIALDQASA